MLKGELENNSRKPWGITENNHSDSLIKTQLTLVQGKMKMGDDVADDNNAMRTSVSQYQVTATLYTEELYISAQYIYSQCGKDNQNLQKSAWTTI